MSDIRVRIGPSPTGDPHVGTAYIALFNQIFAKKHQGKFILRIEDTDQSRSHPEYEENIYKALHWSGITWDEGPDIGGDFGPYRQSERTEIYREHIQILLDQGTAYKCFATKEELQEMRELGAKTGKRTGYDRRYRNLSPEEVKEREAAGQSFVIRLKIPLTGDCVFDDGIKGRITTPWSDIDDQILMKSDGFPTYHFANVVDDYLMKITHVIRGDEWISSTPKHIYTYEAFGWKAPEFLHMPLLLGRDGKKLSKRKNPTSIFFYRDSGYLQEAFINFLSLMGYSMPGDKEIYPVEEFAEAFDASRIGTSGAFFDIQKLDWINQQYLINNIPEEKLWERIKEWSFNDAFIQKLMPLVHTRIKTFGEFMELCQFFFINHMPYTEEHLTPSNITKESAAQILQGMVWRLEELEDWGRKGFEQASRDIAEIFGVNHKKIVMRLLFTTIVGKPAGPPLFDSVDILGKDRARARFLQAIEFLGGVSNKRISALTKAWKNKDCKELVAKSTAQ